MMNRDLKSISKLIEDITRDIDGLVLDGDLYAIEAIVLAKKFESAAKHLKDSWEEDALLSTEVWKGQEFEGYTATQKDGARRYSFKHLDNWNTLNDQRKELESESKNAYLQFLNGNVIVDSDGVIVPQAEPVASKQSIVLTKNKY